MKEARIQITVELKKLIPDSMTIDSVARDHWIQEEHSKIVDDVVGYLADSKLTLLEPAFVTLRSR